MPNYEICYIDGAGKLAFKFAAQCRDERRAKILAHAMKQPEHKCFEIWDDKAALIYRRPWIADDAQA